MKVRPAFLILAASLCALLLPQTVPAVRAQDPIRETPEYQQFVKKPQDEFAKLVFLMNYYKKAHFTVVFDGADYTPEFAFPIAQVYLFTHYKNEKAGRWIKKHCYRSPFQQQIIYLRFPSGKYEPARNVFLRGLAELEKDLKEDQKGKVP